MMDSEPASADALRKAVAELDTIQKAIAALSDRDDVSWRHELIALRRLLYRQIAGIPPLLDASAFAAEDVVEARAAFNRVRTSVALHQANWPAVAIVRDDPRYLASVRDVRAANRDFIALITLLMARRERT